MIKGLVVSCQANEGEPLHGYNMMGIMAKAAVLGGADAIRASSVSDIIEIKKTVSVPVIGLIKRVYAGCDVYITPTLLELKQLIESGCDVIAIDATNRPRPNGQTTQQLVDYAKQYAPHVLLMADVATLSEAINAEKMGFDIISTTMRGYTEETKDVQIPDYIMLSHVLSAVKKPIIAEGGIWETWQLEKILKMGISAVVIGTAITRPKEITARFKKVFDGLNANVLKIEQTSGEKVI